MTVQGDDFTATGHSTSLRWFDAIMANKYETKARCQDPESSPEMDV